MRERIQAIKQGTDLLELVERHTSLRKIGNVSGHGPEYAGPCPRCGGTDRFHVQADAGRWFCRRCHPEWGDVIDYIEWYLGLSTGEALDWLGSRFPAQGTAGRMPTGSPGAAAIVGKTRSIPEGMQNGRPTAGPSHPWRARAAQFLAYAREQLWNSPEALEYLRNRGLTEETIRTTGLGHNPTTLRDDARRWGYQSGKQWQPSGLVIPCEMGGILRYVKIRRDEPDDRGKYVCIRGSAKRGVLYGVDDIGEVWDIIICEGELNALTLRQELAGVCGIVSCGDADNTPGPEAMTLLVGIPRWWAIFDSDEAGERGLAACRRDCFPVC